MGGSVGLETTDTTKHHWNVDGDSSVIVDRLKLLNLWVDPTRESIWVIATESWANLALRCPRGATKGDESISDVSRGRLPNDAVSHP